MLPPHPLWGERIRAARKAAGLSQVQLARALGVTQQRISFWEKGRGGPTDRNKNGLSKLLGVPVYQLFPYDDVNGGEEAA